MGGLLMELHAQIACNLPRDPKMRAVGPLGRLVYIEAFLYCRENLTDGVIDPSALAFIAVDVSTKTKRRLLGRLVEVNALTYDGQTWAFPLPVWCKWNPLRADVEAKREAETQRKQAYRAKLSQRDNDGTDGSVPTGHRVTATDRDRQPEPEPEPEPEPYIDPQDRYDGEMAVIHNLRIGETAW